MDLIIKKQVLKNWSYAYNIAVVKAHKIVEIELGAMHPYFTHECNKLFMTCMK